MSSRSVCLWTDGRAVLLTTQVSTWAPSPRTSPTLVLVCREGPGEGSWEDVHSALREMPGMKIRSHSDGALCATAWSEPSLWSGPSVLGPDNAQELPGVSRPPPGGRFLCPCPTANAPRLRGLFRVTPNGAASLLISLGFQFRLALFSWGMSPRR